MADKNKKKQQQNSVRIEAFQYEFVGAEVLSLLFGVKVNYIYNNRNSRMFDGISTIKRGHGRMYNYLEAARLAYPTLSDFELAILRLEINDKLRNRENEDVKSEMG